MFLAIELKFMVLLYVDDDQEDVYLFMEAVRMANAGYRCVRAGDGDEALQVLKTMKPDCIVLDVNMPKMNGKEALREIRTNKAYDDIPVVMFSTTIDPAERDQYKELGADNCLIKPTSFQALCDIVKKLSFQRS